MSCIPRGEGGGGGGGAGAGGQLNHSSLPTNLAGMCGITSNNQ